MDISKKRKKVLDRLTEIFNTIDPTGKNATRYIAFINKMSDKEFDKFMNNLKNDVPHDRLYLSTQNMTDTALNIDNLLSASKKLNMVMEHHLIITDKSTGVKYKTPYKYFVGEGVVRRAQQYWDHKISVPESDQVTDQMSGQVTNDSRASNLTAPEMLALRQRGFNNTLIELIKVRGGDKTSYDEFSRLCYETGTSSLNVISPQSKAKSVVVLHAYLRGMMLDSTLLE